MADQIEALNGPIEVGDRVAVAVGDGKFGSGMRVGEILEIKPFPAMDGGYKRIEVKVRVEKTSGYHFGKLPYVKTFEDPKRMVKLGALQDAL